MWYVQIFCHCSLKYNILWDFLLVRRNCSLDSMATIQDIFRRAPESAAAMRRRLRAERKGEAGQKDTDLLTQESSIIVDQLVTDKSR